nr:DUF3152 domain-containing protein [Nocardiopsis trehalosi]
MKRRRGGWFRRAPLEILLGLAVLAAGGGLLVVDRMAPGPPEADGAADPPSTPSPTPSASPSAEPPVLLRSVVEEVDEAGGDLRVVDGSGATVGDGPEHTYLVEVEDGLPGDPEDFAAAVEQILGDERGWTGGDDVALRRVDSGPADIRVALAAPATVDAMCAPLRTNGYVSCTQNGRAIINQNRWVSGVEHFDGDLETYRTYVVNHEVGHALGHGHVGCPGAGEPAPVMQQQTFGLDGCAPNGWVHP